MTTILLILLAVLQLADVRTTLRVLGRGGRELNPLLARLYARFGAKSVLLVVKCAVGAWIWYVALHYDSLGFIFFTLTLPQFLGAACALYAAVVWNNRRQIK